MIHAKKDKYILRMDYKIFFIITNDLYYFFNFQN